METWHFFSGEPNCAQKCLETSREYSLHTKHQGEQTQREAMKWREPLMYISNLWFIPGFYLFVIFTKKKIHLGWSHHQRKLGEKERNSLWKGELFHRIFLALPYKILAYFDCP